MMWKMKRKWSWAWLIPTEKDLCSRNLQRTAVSETGVHYKFCRGERLHKQPRRLLHSQLLPWLGLPKLLCKNIRASKCQTDCAPGIPIRTREAGEPSRPFWLSLPEPTGLFKHLASGLKCQLDFICSRIFDWKKERKEERFMDWKKATELRSCMFK